PRGELWSIAGDVHRRVQGSGSGFDVAASVHGGVIRYTSRPRVALSVPVHADIRPLLVWTRQASSTPTHLKAWDRLPPEIAGRLSAISADAVRNVEHGLRNGDRDQLRG